MSGQTVYFQMRLHIKEQSDQGVQCLPFHLHLLDALLYGKTTLVIYRIIMYSSLSGCPKSYISLWSFRLKKKKKKVCQYVSSLVFWASNSTHQTFNIEYYNLPAYLFWYYPFWKFRKIMFRCVHLSLIHLAAITCWKNFAKLLIVKLP